MSNICATDKRRFHRIKSLLEFWSRQDYAVLWLCLTSSRQSDGSKLSNHHRRLKQRAEREFNLPNDILHLNIRTSEGNGTLHLFWACKMDGFRKKDFYVPQEWLSNNWKDIHDSKVVWVKRVGSTNEDISRLSSYCLTQYCAGQDSFEHLSWSWFRIHKIPRRWEICKSRFDNPLENYKKHLGGRAIVLERINRVLGRDIQKIIPPPPNKFEVKKVPVNRSLNSF